MTAEHNVNGMRLLKDDYCVVMHNGRHWRRSAEISKVENGV